MYSQGHWYLVVERWNDTGTQVVGYDRFDYWVFGHQANWQQVAVKPGKIEGGDFLERSVYGTVVDHWHSNAAQDQELIAEWNRIADDEANRPVLLKPTGWINNFLGYLAGWNCFSVAQYFASKGGTAGVPKHDDANFPARKYGPYGSDSQWTFR